MARPRKNAAKNQVVQRRGKRGITLKIPKREPFDQEFGEKAKVRVRGMKNVRIPKIQASGPGRGRRRRSIVEHTWDPRTPRKGDSQEAVMPESNNNSKQCVVPRMQNVDLDDTDVDVDCQEIDPNQTTTWDANGRVAGRAQSTPSARPSTSGSPSLWLATSSSPSQWAGFEHIRPFFRLVGKACMLSNAIDAMIFPSSTQLQNILFQVLKLEPGSKTCMHLQCLLEDRSKTSIFSHLRRDVAAVRGDVSRLIRDGFWAAHGIPAPGARFPSFTAQLREREAKKVMLRMNNSWRELNGEPYGAKEFQAAITAAFPNGVTLQQLAFVHLVIECNVESKPRVLCRKDNVINIKRVQNMIMRFCETPQLTPIRFRICKVDSDLTVARCVELAMKKGRRRRGNEPSDDEDDDVVVESFEWNGAA